MNVYSLKTKHGMQSKQQLIHLYDLMKIQLISKTHRSLKGLSKEPADIQALIRLRVIGKFGDSITTDHISPAGAIGKDTPAGKYLTENGVATRYFNSYGSRRGNHEVMMRGTFANIRIRNQIAKGTEGGFTTYWPTEEIMPIYDAAMKYQEEGTGLAIIAGKDYGMGSSRDWAAKGTSLLGIKTVIAESLRTYSPFKPCHDGRISTSIHEWRKC